MEGDESDVQRILFAFVSAVNRLVQTGGEVPRPEDESYGNTPADTDEEGDECPGVLLA